MHRAALTLLFATTALSAFAQDEDATIAQGRIVAEALTSGDLGAVWDRVTPQMREAVTSLGTFESSTAEMLADLGEETAVTEEVGAVSGDLAIYTRIGEWSLSDAPIVMEIAFTDTDEIAGLTLQPQPVAADSAYLDYETQADLRLPFEGAWTVFWGGRTLDQNYHAADPAQRFALDFVVVENGQTYATDGAQVQDYHCWGRDILAPADGQVVGTVSDLPDLPIGETDPDNPAGNHVILAVGEDEFAFLAHLQQGTVRVQLGDAVAQGDVLGQCGNSGNTSEPHLHVHLQTTPDLLAGEGLPAQFQSYTADGEPVSRGEPLQDEVVAPAD